MKMAVADRITACVFFALGIAMLVGGFTMDRLEIRQIHPLSIPGLMPMLLGAALAVCAVLLWLQADLQSEEGAVLLGRDGSAKRLGLTVALTCFYALVLVGWLPFYWATAVFIAAFTTIFSWDQHTAGSARARVMAQAAVFGLIAAFAVVMLFEKAFLVRLP
ncbi:tripartite tricarboxylate transporter TctB family protein [Paracoccus sp. SCSIO 75233]|uniref:tripartite tricarboxylate transporter TctB family protein n=1 Tax=Paracoccus sp. SCSIO 75233 TaxID=3017782 RepID=UPI0022F1450D|nr:tripartite tricarboxylate transporter TctB family protein [Paracoccus sp. SCSIO 75233]WBU51866.1 tripartite tricarboxylate transporter TctB family protein [Paracoccus sp. SCSIO 75233]